jgi:hypothetical protein
MVLHAVPGFISIFPIRRMIFGVYLIGPKQDNLRSKFDS